MNYYIEKHDMEIILSALEHLHSTMQNRKMFGLGNDKFSFSINDVDGLFQSLDNSFVDNSTQFASKSCD